MGERTPIGRDRAIQLVKEGSLPISLGSAGSTVVVVEQEGMFRIRELVIDRAAAENAAAASKRARSPSWMPEHYFALGQPTGKIIVEAASRDELIERMSAITWPADW